MEPTSCTLIILPWENLVWIKLPEILAMFKGGRGTRASNGISGRNNVFEIFSQKSKRIIKNNDKNQKIMKNFTCTGDRKLIFHFPWPKVHYTNTIQTDK